jgi:hypothetical protein
MPKCAGAVWFTALPGFGCTRHRDDPATCVATLATENVMKWTSFW